MSYYGVSVLVSLAAFTLINNVNGPWQIGPILVIEMAAMYAFFWAGVDGELRGIGFWHENLESIVAILNLLELALLLTMVPWRDAWNGVSGYFSTIRLDASNGEQPLCCDEKSINSTETQEAA